MKKLTAFAAMPLFAGFLMAQSAQTTESKTTTESTQSNMWNGTLVDASCHTSQTAHRESTETSHPDENTTKTTTTTTNTYSTQCPVTITTTAFGLMTPDGQYVAFDQPSNTRIVELVKSNKKYNTYVANGKPVKVKVKGAKKGDVVVIESIQ